MNLERYREYSVVGDTVFREPVGGLYGWSFLAFAVLLTSYQLVTSGPEVALPAGGSLLFMAVSLVLPERHHALAVGIRIVGLVAFVALWAAIIVFFPDAPTFFEGGW